MKNPAAVALGRLGGKATSEAKAVAARENAKKGGWPNGKPRKPKRVARRSNDQAHPTAADSDGGASGKESNGK